MPTLYRLIRLIRITIEVIVILLLTIVLAGTGFRVGDTARWIADLQIIPAALTISLPILIFWTAATLVFGRIYCSTICPMGSLMDIVSRLRQWTQRKHHYRYVRPANASRIVWFSLFIGLVAIGAIYIAILLDPYHAYSDICRNLFQSVWAIATAKTIAITVLGCITSSLTLIIVTLVAWRRGRWLCNTVCPVGTTLGTLSRYSALHIDIDTDLCTQCGRCRDVCKAECIDLSDHLVDQSRCVICFNCVSVCRDKAIRYTWQRKQLSLPMLHQTFSRPSPGTCAGCSRLSAPEPHATTSIPTETISSHETIS